ncbi:MAG: C40 family peptidase [Crocinitomicaceae bacterium]|nr:C40 family peptidase [Crocinitomicaceae bacterium]
MLKYLSLWMFLLPFSFAFAQAEEEDDSTSLTLPLDSVAIDTFFVSDSSPADSALIDTTRNEEIDELISFAKTFLGTPYKWAGTTPSGFDCSGFIYYILGNFGFEITRTSYGMADLGRQVKLSEVRPGDLLFFKGRSLNSTKVAHVGMVIEVRPDAIFFIHSSSSRGVVIDNFKTSKYYIPRFLKAKRIDYGIPDDESE